MDNQRMQQTFKDFCKQWYKDLVYRLETESGVEFTDITEETEFRGIPLCLSLNKPMFCPSILRLRITLSDSEIIYHVLTSKYDMSFKDYNHFKMFTKIVAEEELSLLSFKYTEQIFIGYDYDKFTEFCHTENYLIMFSCLENFKQTGPILTRSLELGSIVYKCLINKNTNKHVITKTTDYLHK